MIGMCLLSLSIMFFAVVRKMWLFCLLSLLLGTGLSMFNVTINAWLKVESPKWLPKAVAAVALSLMAAQLLSQPWLFSATLSNAISMAIHYAITGLHLAFLLALIVVVQQGLRSRARETWLALPSILSMCTVLFSSELALLGVPGIWFPWGIGVSLSEYASMAFDLLFFCLLTQRLWQFVPQPPRKDKPSFADAR